MGSTPLVCIVSTVCIVSIWVSTTVLVLAAPAPAHVGCTGSGVRLPRCRVSIKFIKFGVLGYCPSIRLSQTHGVCLLSWSGPHCQSGTHSGAHARSPADVAQLRKDHMLGNRPMLLRVGPPKASRRGMLAAA